MRLPVWCCHPPQLGVFDARSLAQAPNHWTNSKPSSEALLCPSPDCILFYLTLWKPCRCILVPVPPSPMTRTIFRWRPSTLHAHVVLFPPLADSARIRPFPSRPKPVAFVDSHAHTLTRPGFALLQSAEVRFPIPWPTLAKNESSIVMCGSHWHLGSDSSRTDTRRCGEVSDKVTADRLHASCPGPAYDTSG